MPIENIVFSGGGVKGLAYVGALDQLQATNYLKLSDIKRIAGTSAGSIIAALLSVGYKIDELRILSEIDLKTFLDEESTKISIKGKFLKTVEKYSSQSEHSFFSTVLPMASVSPKLLLRLTEQFSLYDGDALRIFIEKKFSKKLSNVGCYLTFEELHNLVIANPSEYCDP
jgi:predicted acylesterase/phospholipase RssA